MKTFRKYFNIPIIVASLATLACVTKVQVIYLNSNGDQDTTMDALQKGSEDSLNGNEGKLKLPLPAGG